MLGSVSSYALAYCPSPVLTVPADIVAEAAKPTTYPRPWWLIESLIDAID